MSKENEMKAEEKAMQENEPDKKAAGAKESGEINPDEMEDVAGGLGKKRRYTY